jgi:truncated hemoglobin YjbI
MSGRELAAWAVIAVAAAGWITVLIVVERTRRKRKLPPEKVASSTPPPPRRNDAADHDLTGVTLLPRPELFPGVPETHVLTDPPRVAAPGASEPLRDWLRHFAGIDAWPVAVSRFYTRAAADPAIAVYFARVDMEKLQRHFLAALMIVTGQGVTVGVVRRMRDAHATVRNGAGAPITGEVWDATIGVLAEVLGELGTPPATLVALATTIAPIRAAIVGEPEVAAR